MYEFGPFRLDAGERVLQKAGEPVPLTPKTFDLLVLLVENQGRLLEKEFLLKNLWPDSFVEEANLPVNISMLRKALGEDEIALIETVPKKGYRFAAPVRQQTAAPAGRRWWVGGALAAMALLAGAALYMRRPLPPEVRTIAVLPFQTLTGDEAHRYLGLGMADAVITRLSNVQAVSVRPTSAVEKYVGAKADALAAGRALQVDALLEGRIQQVDQNVRVTVQLLRVSDGAPLWAEGFEDSFRNIFDVQDSISRKIADALSLRLSGTEQQRITRRHTRNLEAYESYLQGQYLVSQRTPEGAENAVRHFQGAIEKDAQYALPHAALAAAYITQAGSEVLGPAEFSLELREKARQAALRALSLDPQLADAHVSLGEILMRADWNWVGARRSFEQALAIDRNSFRAHAAQAVLLTALGQHDEAIREMEAAARLDPASPVLRSDFGWVLYCARRYEAAIAQSQKAIEMDPWSSLAQRQLAKEYFMNAQHAQAIDTLRKTMSIAGSRYTGGLADLGQAYARAGRRAEAEAIRRELEQRGRQEPVSPYALAVLYASLGDREAAFQALQRACDRRLSRVLWLAVEPEMDLLRSDARFSEILRRMDLAR